MSQYLKIDSLSLSATFCEILLNGKDVVSLCVSCKAYSGSPFFFYVQVGICDGCISVT